MGSGPAVLVTVVEDVTAIGHAAVWKLLARVSGRRGVTRLWFGRRVVKQELQRAHVTRTDRSVESCAVVLYKNT